MTLLEAFLATKVGSKIHYIDESTDKKYEAVVKGIEVDENTQHASFILEDIIELY